MSIMKYCPKCGTQCNDADAVCAVCGTPLAITAPAAGPYDHTAEFDAKDISENKVFAMLPYLLDILGVLIALIASKESPYTRFHVRQALKLTVVNALLVLASVVLCWTVLVPIAAAVCAIIILVLRIICFFQICNGKAAEPAIICKLGFLK